MEKIEKPVQKWKLPQVRIEAAELVSVLEKCTEQDAEITATNGNCKFSSLEDIRENCHELEGNPTFKLGNAEIHFGKGYLEGVHHHSLTSDPDIHSTKLLAEKLSKHLRPYRTWIRNGWVRYFLAFSIGGYLGVAQMEYFPAFDMDGGWFWLNFLFPGAYSLVILELLEKRLLTDKQVYFQTRTTFWRRNRDSIITGIVVGTVVAFLAYLLS